jgi:spermidine/putrescine transport system permease protein
VVVNARLAGMDPRLEQAAMDLYATPLQTFRYVTFPIALPGIMAAALLSFSLSFDDFIVTTFNSGRVVTFPIYIWGAAQRGIPPQVNVIASLMFLGSLLLVLVASVISKRRKALHA